MVREHAEPAEVGCGLIRRYADGRDFQTAADDFSHLSNRYSLFGNRVVPAPWYSLFQRESVETGDVEDVRGRPAIESVTQVRRDALFAGYLDQVRDEALLHRIVDLREAYH